MFTKERLKILVKKLSTEVDTNFHLRNHNKSILMEIKKIEKEIRHKRDPKTRIRALTHTQLMWKNLMLLSKKLHQ